MCPTCASRPGSCGTTLQKIDLVYNRVTDFDLTSPASAALHAAWRSGAAVVSPNPWHHSLYAHKANLPLLSDVGRLRRWGLNANTTLDSLLPAQTVDAVNGDRLWAERKRWVFKPERGYGSRGVYRGDKITRKAFAAVADGGYIAQALAPAPQRSIRLGAESRLLKYDLRLFTFAGRPLLLAARVYQGQVTNFRTPGGGFAPVYVW